MKKKTYFSLITFIPFFLKAQIPDSALNAIQSKIVYVHSYRPGLSKVDSGLDNTACGFIIGGKYLCTCHHVLISQNGTHSDDLFMYYNFKDHGLTSTYDSVKIILRLKKVKNRFNFDSKYYVSGYNGSSTDFKIVGIYKKKIPNLNIEITADTVALGESVYSEGPYFDPSVSERIMNRLNTQLIYLGNEDIKGVNFMTFMGEAGPGFSGSLIFNAAGHPLAMLQSMWTIFPPHITQKYRNGQISKKQYDYISSSFKSGKKILTAIPLTYLYAKYMKGYY